MAFLMEYTAYTLLFISMFKITAAAVLSILRLKVISLDRKAAGYSLES